MNPDEGLRRRLEKLAGDPSPAPRPDLVAAEVDLVGLRVCTSLGDHHPEGRLVEHRLVGRCSRCGVGVLIAD